MGVSKTTFPLVIFADGASSGNPGPGGWGAIIVSQADGRVLELGGGGSPVTNNQMELQGVISALRAIEKETGPVDIYTDSTYVIRGITQWIWAWRAKDWKTSEGNDVSNQKLWKQLFALVAARGKANPIGWKYVRGHSGVPGNERVDEIAVQFSKGHRAELYRGSLLKYPVAVLDLPENTELPKAKPIEKKEKKAAYSYVSLLGQTPNRHANWTECERRVKGQSGAKFKKAMSAEEEAQILAEWGFSPEDLKT